MRLFSNALDRFCRKHPKFGINNLMLYIAIGNAVVYLFGLMDTSNQLISFLTMSPDLILKGQVWRLVTFIIVPDSSNLLFLILSLYFYYWVGGSLEQQWGSGQFTVYYFMGALFTLIGGFVCYFLTGLRGLNMTASYINLSMFFAFATIFPDMQVRIYFLIPVKIKWLAILDAVWFLYAIITLPLIYKFLPVLGILNYLLFCGSDLYAHLRKTSRLIPRKNAINFKKAAKQANQKAQGKPYSRKCSVCGKTDADYPDLEFRYCSRCKGFHCFCIEHINNHIHFTD